jgi:uncharacterized protein
MGKYLLLIAGVIAFYWMVTSSKRRRVQSERERQPEDMVRCVRCGVHLPRGESLMLRGKFYCCDEHRSRDEAES